MGCSLPQAENLTSYCTGLGSNHALQGSCALSHKWKAGASESTLADRRLFSSAIHSTPQHCQVQGLGEALTAQHGG